MKPLKELAAGSSPILDTGQVVKLFGPVEHLLQIHELFYIALGMRTKEWSPQSQIGDVFLSSVRQTKLIFLSALFLFYLSVQSQRNHQILP